MKKIVLYGLIVIIVISLSIGLAISASVLQNGSDKEKYNVTFEIEPGLTKQTLYITIQNLQDSADTLDFSTILNQTNFGIEDINSIQIYQHKKIENVSIADYDSISKNYTSVNDDYIYNTTYFWDYGINGSILFEHNYESFDSVNKKWYWNEIGIIGFHNESKWIWDENILTSKIEDGLKGEVKHHWENVPIQKAGQQKDTIKLMLVINHPFVKMENGWGSTGIVWVTLNGETYVDLTNSSWWNITLKRKSPVCINNTGGSALTDYQVQLNVTYDADMQADFDDLRFVNVSAGTEEAYWIEDKLDSNWCLVWFNATYIKGDGWSNDTTEMYYNNSSLSSTSDITGTFIDSDDFEETLGNVPSQWSYVEGDNPSFAISNDTAKIGTRSGKITLPSNTGYYNSYDFNISVTTPKILEFSARLPQTSGYMYIRTRSASGWAAFPCQFYNDANIKAYNDVSLVSLRSYAANTWYDIKVEFTTASYQFDMYVDDVLEADNFGYYADADIAKIRLMGIGTGTGYIDIVRVRKYIDPEPTAQLGTEESQPLLTTGNISNIKYDWGQDFSTNFSANVTDYNASNVWMNFTNAEFTNTSLGNLNLTINEWVNESHNVNAPVTNVSVTVTLVSSSSGAVNDSDSFYYNITKRTNTATMDSDATQSKDTDETFYINATCNEEYGDTFYGAADLFEDASIVSTDSSVIDYVKFSWNESSVGVYNYTVRFYNTTHYYNTTTPTFSNVTVLEAPKIVSWYNNKTEDNSTTIYINQSENIYFNVTANQTIDTWTWFKDDVDIGNNFDNVTINWIFISTKTLKVIGNNTNGTTNTITWTIKVSEIEKGYYLGLFLTIFGLAVCFFFYGAIDTNAWIYTNILSTFLGGTMFFVLGFMSFVGVYSGEQVHQYGEVGLLFVVIGAIGILYGILQVFKLGIDEFGMDEREEDRDETYEYK